jgi:hypothetical protein
MQDADDVLVEYALRMVAVNDGADTQLGLAGSAELAHDDHVERRIECQRYLVAHRHTAAGQRQHQRMLILVPQQLGRQLAAGILAVLEHLSPHRSSVTAAGSG